jgi:hypothetical protein
MLREREVTGNRWTVGVAAAGAVTGVAGVGAAPPVLAASAELEPAPMTVRLQISALAIRGCKTTTSFLGLRG